MRWLIRIVLVLAVLWGGYWYIGQRAFEAGAANWFAQMQASGKQAENAGLEVHGFPNRFDLTITAPKIFDPDQGMGWQADFLQILTLSYTPWHVIAAFPPEQRITLPHETITLNTAKMQASVVVSPEPDLPLDRITLVADALTAAGDIGWRVAAGSLRFATKIDPTRENSHEVGLEVSDITPDASLTALVNGALPAQIKMVRLDAYAGFSAPIDRFVLTTNPQLDSLEIKDLRVLWGDVTVSASGSLQVDAAGFATGGVTLQLENWRLALDIAQAMGMIAPEARNIWDSAASLLALQSGGKDAIQLPLSFVDGETRIGPVQVGPAPRMR
ncbi:DUF2125 domain-containing protein [Pseudorhodobacter sp.]|uniref:DUF2125 domain-containing protein n=1 Tax=Pseudorhodobacter sp. TaxID=1934400 RepID=UPI0026485908|nr:DUF2125 domain-containing protein [Pseudorhodobacter sp.]MDN5786342.1 DUF2125 domain-containing protein [Pseudorhodobacter sp.]